MLAAMLVTPVRRAAVIARLRREAMTRGPLLSPASPALLICALIDRGHPVLVGSTDVPDPTRATRGQLMRHLVIGIRIIPVQHLGTNEG
jgi:hypothetical protein